MGRKRTKPAVKPDARPVSLTAPVPLAPLSLRAYARHRGEAGLAGATHHAVQVAIDSGRLSKSLTPDRKQIADADAADAEWEATTHVDRIPLSGPTAAGTPPPDLAESRARREAAEAALAEIELAEKRGELVLAKDVESKLVNVFAHCKTKLLAVPSRVRQRDPALTGPQVELIEAAIREALDDLAGGAES
jgi:phage terminase Nu1 subunit (DNA packaging protein)